MNRPDPARVGLIGAGIALAVIFAVAASTSSSGPAPAADVPEPAPAAIPDATTAPSETPMLQPGDQVEPGTFAAQVGIATMPTKTADLTVTADVGGQQFDIEAQVDFSDEPALSRLSIPVAGQHADVVLDGAVLYASMGPVTGDRYLRVDLEDPPAPLDRLPTEQINVVTGLGALIVGADEVVYDGPDEGLERYTLRTESSKLAELHDTPGLGGLPEELVTQVWLNDDGTVYHLRTDLGSAGQVTAVANAWGEPVQIDVPTEDQLFQMPELPRIS